MTPDPIRKVLSTMCKHDVRFWFLEARTPGLLVELAMRFPELLNELRPHRALLMLLPQTTEREIDLQLAEEQARERELDRAHWEPLKTELETLRHPLPLR